MDSNSIDLRTFKVIASQDIELAAKQGIKTVVIRQGAVITPSARDFASSRGITLTVDGSSFDGTPDAVQPGPASLTGMPC